MDKLIHARAAVIEMERIARADGEVRLRWGEQQPFDRPLTTKHERDWTIDHQTILTGLSSLVSFEGLAQSLPDVIKELCLSQSCAARHSCFARSSNLLTISSASLRLSNSAFVCSQAASASASSL